MAVLGSGPPTLALPGWRGGEVALHGIWGGNFGLAAFSFLGFFGLGGCDLDRFDCRRWVGGGFWFWGHLAFVGAHRHAARERRPVLDRQPRHAHLAADERRVAADDEPVVRRHGAAHLPAPGDLDVAGRLQRPVDRPGYAQVALDVQLTDKPVVGTEDYRAARTVRAVPRRGRDWGRRPTARTPGAQSHPSGRARSALRHRRSAACG